MSWKTAKLGEISTVSSSKRIFARQYTNKGVPFYRQKEIIDKKNKVELTDILYISQETYDEIKAKFGAPKKGDLLITAVGVTLGIPYVVDDETFYFKDGNLIWLRDFDESADSKFVYYWITSETGKKAMWSRTIGSAQPALTIDTIKQFEIPYPPIEK
ncbi:restriction endonuclease subunit S [Ruminococcus sp.]|uniref:restriction endonuclease subunit S n=1 Tax=Ruminococcus sp. TaxID=41978 RepID=UPI0025D6C6EE|nr:restriction endonuclease subunit S [Ruminococcus sp.]